MRTFARLLSVALLAAGAIVASPVQAQLQLGVGEPGRGNCAPFGCYQDVLRFQQVYNASAFIGPLSFSAFTLFHTQADPGTGELAPGNYLVRFSYSANAAHGLSSNLDENILGAQTLFANLDITPGTSGAATTFTVTGGVPFFYDPSVGNLLLDVVYSNISAPLETYFDRDYGNPIMSRAYTFEDGSSFTDSLALVTRFESVVYVTPEPGTLMLAGLGFAVLVFVTRIRTQRSR